MDRLGHALTRLDRRKEPVAVLFLDLDDFKGVNDSFGHEVGDRVLVKVAERLRPCLRPEDTVARLGGDEFTILLQGVADRSGATRTAERILNETQAPFFFEGAQRSSTPASASPWLPRPGTSRKTSCEMQTGRYKKPRRRARRVTRFSTKAAASTTRGVPCSPAT